jgi:hypothetical protein
MAGVPAGLPAGIRLTDHIGLGVIARAISPERVREVLAGHRQVGGLLRRAGPSSWVG